jgi:hypothetical protein
VTTSVDVMVARSRWKSSLVATPEAARNGNAGIHEGYVGSVCGDISARRKGEKRNDSRKKTRI